VNASLTDGSWGPLASLPPLEAMVVSLTVGGRLSRSSGPIHRETSDQEGKGEAMNGIGRSGSRATVVGVLASTVVLAVLAALMLAACGGGSPPSASPPTVSSTSPARGASPVATPATTAEVTAAYFDALNEVGNISGFRRLVWLYADDAHYEDRAMGFVADGRTAIADRTNALFLEGPLKATSVSQLAGSDWAAVEEMASYGGQLYGVDILRVRHGRIVTEYVYYNDMGSDSVKYRPAPLKTSPAPADTQVASQALATDYASALRSLGPARLAALYAQNVVYENTGRDRLYVGPSAAIAAHARMYALKGLSFHDFRVVAGPGWAAVMWKRTDREGGKPLVDIPDEYTGLARRPTIHGATILEIRDGKIARETIYCDHLRTEF
jgi:hypothetical protein